MDSNQLPPPVDQPAASPPAEKIFLFNFTKDQLIILNSYRSQLQANILNIGFRVPDQDQAAIRENIYNHGQLIMIEQLLGYDATTLQNYAKLREQAAIPNGTPEATDDFI